MGIRSNIDLGHTLRQMRQAAGLTQAQLGDKASLRQRTISDVEQGRGCTTETLFALLTALGAEITVDARRVTDFIPGNY
ncbi:helix-turn-helix domain-containing protein [Nitrospirillum sp. BR 11752]|uniref:helix-turn-helix transcriptional regulator n=1 Tax=Nitrospirillum sp. BR 11752 TaxID=3104293 RepID=UPI002EAB80BD|nr:helix-turn-helix domain-containing protein [Nitrospirillum sp. BR 11752]